MLTLRHWWRGVIAWANAPAATTTFTPRPDKTTETLSLRDWSDLPTHHPRCERTPC